MPLLRLPSARIAVLTISGPLWRTLHQMLANDLTTVARYRSVGELTAAERPDIVIIDRTLIQKGGLELRRIRQHWLTCVLIVTGTNDADDAEQLLNLGADDALRAGHQLLIPRLRAAARRARTINAGMRTAIGDVIFDRESRRVWCAGQEVHLTRREEALLDCLFWYAPRAANIAELTSFAWGHEGERERPNLVHVYIGYLRKKLKGSQLVKIRTVRGAGFQFVARREGVAD